jgi:hypothetical protein
MREFSKSVASAGLAGVLFGARQMTNVLTQPPRNGESDPATEGLNAIAQAAADQLGSLRETYHAANRIQQSAIDTGWRFVSFDAFNSYGTPESMSSFAKQTTDQLRKWMGTDCGCGSSQCKGDCGCQGGQRESDPASPWRTNDPEN